MRGKKKNQPDTAPPAGAQTEGTAATVAAAPWETAWAERVGAFAAALNLDVKAVNEALKPVIGNPGADALGYLADEGLAPTADIQAALTAAGINVPTAAFKANVKLLRGPKPEAPGAATAVEGMAAMWAGLPKVPDETSFLTALQVGGVAKVDELTVLAAVKGSLAYRYGFDIIPEKLLGRMDQFAEDMSEPLQGEKASVYNDLRTQIVERRWSEVLRPMGLTSYTVSPKFLRAFLKKMDELFWAGIFDFQQQLTGWYKTWYDAIYGPGGMASMMMNPALNPAFGGMAPQGVLPTAGMEAPDTGIVTDAAKTFMNVINKVFAGMNIYAARLVGFDAQRTKNVLEDPRLPVMVGATTREQMLQMMDINIPWDILRLETNIATYAYAVMMIKNLPGGQEELRYFNGLYLLGNQIPWDKLMRAGDKPRQEGPFGATKPERF